MKKLFLYQSLFLFWVVFSFPLCTYAQISSEDSAYKIKQEPVINESEDAYAAIGKQDTILSLYYPIPGDSLNAIISNKGFYYKNYMDSLLRATKKTARKTSHRQQDGFLKKGMELLIWVAAIALLIWMIFRFFISRSSLFLGNRKNKNFENGQAFDNNDANPELQLQSAIQNGQYRLAVRLLYLQSLNALADKKIVEIGKNKTNFRYVKEIKNESIAGQFARLTLIYEYAWYGEYPVERLLFDQIYPDFATFNKKIKAGDFSTTI